MPWLARVTVRTLTLSVPALSRSCNSSAARAHRVPGTMSILRVATRPVMERGACFLDNDDLGQLGCASSLLYKVVSIALTMWAVWDPCVPGGGQWVGSPMVLNRAFVADTTDRLEE